MEGGQYAHSLTKQKTPQAAYLRHLRGIFLFFDVKNRISDAEIDIPVRVYNCLYSAGINTVEELLRLSSDDFSRIRNLGRKNLEWFLNFQNNYQDTRIQNKKTEPDRDKIKSLSRFFDTLISQ